MIDSELHLRGHRALLWKAHVQDLRANGVDPTIDALASSSDRYDFAAEEALGKMDYSGGTEGGKLYFSIGKRRHIASILSAESDKLVIVDGDMDNTCYSCARKEPRHCNQANDDDSRGTKALVSYARSKGYEVEYAYRKHPLNPDRLDEIALIPAGIIQQFVFEE